MRLFSKIFQCPQSVLPSICLIFCNRTNVKKSQRVLFSMFKNLKGPPFTVFGIVKFFKRNNFRVKIRFSQVRHAISDFCCFKRLCVFSMRLFKKICFTEAPPQLLPETKRFARVKDSSRFSALCDLLETISIFFPQFSFLKVFS